MYVYNQFLKESYKAGTIILKNMLLLITYLSIGMRRDRAINNEKESLVASFTPPTGNQAATQACA